MVKTPAYINDRGRRYKVTGRLRLGRRDYYVLDHCLNSRRSKYCVFDSHAGPQGELRALQVLPRNRRSRDYVDVVRRVSEGNVNLPKLIEYHQTRGTIYLVLTWIYGCVLREYIDRCRAKQGRRPDCIESFKLFRGLAHGLRHMHHKKNFVHGDIRPENLVLCREPNRLVLIDYGNAWPVERTASRAPGDGVSEFYNAPEQLRGARFVDFRSDQFSATVLFYELLTLDLPYQGLGGKAGMNDFHETSLRNAFEPPSRKSPDRFRLPRSVWKRIDRVVERGMAIRPDARYPNAKAWLRDIDAIQALLWNDTRLSVIHMSALGAIAWLGRIWPFGQQN